MSRHSAARATWQLRLLPCANRSSWAPSTSKRFIPTVDRRIDVSQRGNPQESHEIALCWPPHGFASNVNSDEMFAMCHFRCNFPSSTSGDETATAGFRSKGDHMEFANMAS